MNKQGPRRFPRRTRPLHLWEAGKPGETRETHTPRGETLQDSRCSTSISHLFLPLFPLLLGSTASEGFLHSLASFGPSPPLFLCSLRPLLPSSFLGLFSIWETKIFPGPQAVCTAGGGRMLLHLFPSWSNPVWCRSSSREPPVDLWGS